MNFEKSGSTATAKSEIVSSVTAELPILKPAEFMNPGRSLNSWLAESLSEWAWAIMVATRLFASQNSAGSPDLDIRSFPIIGGLSHVPSTMLWPVCYVGRETSLSKCSWDGPDMQRFSSKTVLPLDSAATLVSQR